MLKRLIAKEVPPPFLCILVKVKVLRATSSKDILATAVELRFWLLDINPKVDGDKVSCGSGASPSQVTVYY
jgi:hypothetical protein